MKNSGGRTQSPGWGKKLNLGSTHSVPCPLNMLSHWILPTVLWGACHYSCHLMEDKAKPMKAEWVTTWLRRNLLQEDPTREPTMELPLPSFVLAWPEQKFQVGNMGLSYSPPFLPSLLFSSFLPPLPLFLFSFLFLISKKKKTITSWGRRWEGRWDGVSPFRYPCACKC